MSTQVVTYQHAYVGGTTSLCDRCRNDAAVLAALPSLGPVSHGLHVGDCDGCALDLPCGVPGCPSPDSLHHHLGAVRGEPRHDAHADPVGTYVAD